MSQERRKTAQDLLAEFSAKEVELRTKDFFAPYAEVSKFAVVKIQGAHYRFRIIGFKGSGFGIFRPVDPTCARFVRTADFDDVHNYLQLLPKHYFILVCQTNIGWCVYPFNAEVAAKKFGAGTEVILRNVSDVDRFDVVTARHDGMNFWYEEPFSGADPVKAETLRECFALRTEPLKMKKKLDAISGLTPEEKRSLDLAMASWREYQQQTTEGQVREWLARGGADLDNYVIRGEQIEITWQARSGRYFRSRVDKDSLDVVSAGICLSGGDAKFHLKDLPGLIEEGERRGVIYTTDVVDQPRGLEMDDDEY